ncbi:Serine/threonine-protein kinase UCN [Spatholobus suberectus]|nr:Serine/threonine-protein kinase UCN [Spatholobus suberectus]
MLYSTTPFKGKNRKEMLWNASPPSLPSNQFWAGQNEAGYAGWVHLTQPAKNDELNRLVRRTQPIFPSLLTKLLKFVRKGSTLTNLVERLLEKDLMKWLGYTCGTTEIKEYESFCGVRWELLTKVVRPPFISAKEDDARESPKKFGNGGVVQL